MERKARFIAQLKTGNTAARTAADVGGDDLGNAAAATKAIATGDTRYVEQVQLDDDVKRLTAMQRAHSDAKARNAAERRSVAREVAAVSEQIGELELVLPALAANEQAPFAMTVRASTYRERAEAAPALLDSLRQAYVEGKRYGNTKEFPIAELRRVQVRASRMLSSDEMIVTLSVPGRSRSIQAKDFTGMDAAPIGLVRRVENMVADTANYRDELTRRYDHAVTRVSELEAVADEPFEHTDALRDKRQRLDSLTAQLQTSANSPEAKAKAAEHQARLDAHGRQPGWSLALNPTPAMRAELAETDTTHARPGPAHPGGLAPAPAEQHRETPPAAVSRPPTARQLIQATMAPEVAAQRPPTPATGDERSPDGAPVATAAPTAALSTPPTARQLIHATMAPEDTQHATSHEWSPDGTPVPGPEHELENTLEP